MHWAVRAAWKRAWEEEVAIAVLQKRQSLAEAKGNATEAIPKVLVTLYTLQPMDKDNSYRSAKPLFDGLVKAGAIANDRQVDVDEEVQSVKVAHRADERVELTITY